MNTEGLDEVAIIRHQDDSYPCWYIYGTVDYLSRPRGYYFHLDKNNMCFGPFDSASLALESHQRWLKTRAGDT